MSFYNRDPSLPYWQANVDTQSIFDAFSHRPEKAQAWLRYRDVCETSVTFNEARIMRGHFEGGILGRHTYHWTFTPTYKGDPAIVLPVYEHGRLVDLLAIARHDYRIWGCTTGAGQSVGQFVCPTHDRSLPVTLSVHETPISWLTSGQGILPLSKSFFPLLQFAHSIIAQDGEHAWEIAHQAFIYPAERLGLDCNAAEQAAFDRISFDEAAV
jgi:hypothetical protein